MQLRSLTPQSEFRMMNEPLSRNATPLLFLPRPQLEEARSNDTLADLPSTPRGSGELSATNLQDRFNNETPTLNNIFKDAASDFSLGFTTSLSNEMGENNVHLSPGQAFVACEMARDKAHTRNTNGGEYREAPPTMITSPNRSPATKFHCSPVPVRQNAACIPSPRSPHYTRSPSTIRAQPFSGPPASLPPSFSELITHWKPVSMERCVPLRSPLPPRFQGNIEQHKDDTLPEFVSLVNYPNSATLRQNKMLPPRMRCCVMCGQIRPTCSRSKGNNNNNMKGPDNISAPNSPRQERNPCVEGDGVTIPLQNKGLCTMCDVNVWVIIRSGMQIKWCKGCKNFRPWAAFTDKGLATKCLRCRERQREKYALLKESKHKKLKKTKSNTLFLEGANHPSIQGSKNWAE